MRPLGINENRGVSGDAAVITQRFLQFRDRQLERETSIGLSLGLGNDTS